MLEFESYVDKIEQIDVFLPGTFHRKEKHNNLYKKNIVEVKMKIDKQVHIVEENLNVQYGVILEESASSLTQGPRGNSHEQIIVHQKQ